jgi:hypothetical protein
MCTPRRRWIPWLAVLAPLLAHTPGARSAIEAAPRAVAILADATPPPPCCFTHPRYSGTCEVAPAKDETCARILEYLNNPMSQGKSYCGNTTLRGDWRSVACEPRQEEALPITHPSFVR